MGPMNGAPPPFIFLQIRLATGPTPARRLGLPGASADVVTFDPAAQILGFVARLAQRFHGGA